MTDNTTKKEEQLPFLQRYANGLFENGVEGYDPSTKTDPHIKGVVNPGGAKIHFHPKWKTEDKILITNPDLDRVLRELPVVLYTLNRIQLENGKPKWTQDGTGYNRTHTGLMLYAQMDENPDCGEKIRDRILEAVKTVSLKPYIEVASKIPDPEGKIRKALESQKHQDFMRNLIPLKLHACVIIAIPSGPQAGFWSMQSMKTASRTAMSEGTTAAASETGDIPF